MMLGNTGFMALYLFAGLASSGISLLFSKYNRQPFYQSHGASVSSTRRPNLSRLPLSRYLLPGRHLRHDRFLRRRLPAYDLPSLLHRARPGLALRRWDRWLRHVLGVLQTRWNNGQRGTCRRCRCRSVLVLAKIRQALSGTEEVHLPSRFLLR
jgi:hypothetical protein